MTPTPHHPDPLSALGRSRERVGRPRQICLRCTATLLTIVALSGCQSISMNSAQLRVIDASPDSGTIDSYQNSSALAYNLGFGTMTSYVPIVSGTSTLAAAKAGTRQTLVAKSGTLLSGQQYTEIIGSSLVNLQQAVFLDQSTPAPSGQVALRFIHEASGSAAVDVYLVPKSGRLTTTSPLAIDLNFGTNSGYINVPEGTYAINVVPTGTLPAPSTVTLLNGAQVAYPSGAVRTIVLIDQEISGTQHAAVTSGMQVIVADDADAQ